MRRGKVLGPKRSALCETLGAVSHLVIMNAESTNVPKLLAGGKGACLATILLLATELQGFACCALGQVKASGSRRVIKLAAFEHR